MQWLMTAPSGLAGSIAICVLMVASPALAHPIFWEDELRRIQFILQIGRVKAEGTGAVRVGVGTSGLLNGLKFPPQPRAIARGTIMLTDPASQPLISLRLTAHLLPGTLTVESMGLGIGGWLTYCLLVPGCINSLPMRLTAYGTRGVGLGGMVTLNTFAKAGMKISVYAAPWTLGVTTTTGEVITTTGGETTTTGGETARGIGSPADGVNPISFETGAVQGVVSQVIHVADIQTGPVRSHKDRAWLKFRFIPEPDQNLLLLAGVLGLCVLGHGRMRRDG